MKKETSIIIAGVEYVPKGSEVKLTEILEIIPGKVQRLRFRVPLRLRFRLSSPFIEEQENTNKKGSEVSTQAINTEGLEYCIVRTYSAGVFAGYLKSRDGKEGVVLEARRLHYWDGAASLSQLSQEGVTKPENCRFPIPMPEVRLTEIIEVIPCTEKARLSIADVPVWEVA